MHSQEVAVVFSTNPGYPVDIAQIVIFLEECLEKRSEIMDDPSLNMRDHSNVWALTGGIMGIEAVAINKLHPDTAGFNFMIATGTPQIPVTQPLVRPAETKK